MSIQFDIPVSQSTLNIISRIDRFQGDWSAGSGIPAERLVRLEEAARIQSIGASCRLSGIHVADNDIVGILRGSGLSLSDGKAVLGYSDGIDFDLGEDALIEADRLRGLNAVVLGQGGQPGPWRQSMSHWETFDSEGHATGRVIPILPPRLIPEKLEDLLTWYELERRGKQRHPLTTVGVFILGLLAISPFERGNGRTIRALTGHLLRRAGYDYVPYGSIESRMEDLREVYYHAFDQSQSGMWSGSADVSPWLEYFTRVLDAHRANVEAKLSLERAAADLSPLQRAILETVREHGTVDAGLLLEATGANRNTLKDNVRRLVNRGVLEKAGERRAARYRLAALIKPKNAAGVLTE